MTKLSFAVAGTIMLCLGACKPAITDWTSSEADNRLTIDNASRDFPLVFLPRSDRLAPGEARRIAGLIARGDITSRDRVTLSTDGPPVLVARRTEALAALLLRYGILIAPGPAARVPRNGAILEVNRYLVTLPACPNWSKPAASDFTNTTASNFGCSTAINLGQTVAYPADLASGQPTGPAAGIPAVAAIQRYNADKNALPAENSALPVPGGSTGTPAAGGNTTGGS